MSRMIKCLLVALVLLGWTGSANASSAWYLAEVDRTGISTGNIVIMRLTHKADTPAFNGKWFKAPTEIGKEMLATTLAAITSGKKVWIRVDLSSASVPELTRLYITK